MATFADLYGRVNRYTDTSDTTTAKAHVNDAYREIVREAKATVTTATKTLTSGTATYSIPTDFTINDLLSLEGLIYTPGGQTTGYPVSVTSLANLLAIRQSLTTGFVMLYCLRDLNTLELYPAPQTSTDTLTLYYVQAPTALSADGDVPSAIPSEWQNLIALTAAARMADEEDSIQLTAVFTQRYQTMLSAFRQFIRDRQGRQPRMTTIGYPTNYPRAPHDRSTYFTGDC